MPIYMKTDGITGSATGKYNGWIELDSVQLNPGRSFTSSTGRVAARDASPPSVSEIVVTKHTDVASTKLFQASLGGGGKKVVIHFVKEDSKGQVPYLALELENTLISGFSVSSHGGASTGRPMESLTLNYSKITYSATPVAASTAPADVKDRALWNLATGGGPSGP